MGGRGEWAGMGRGLGDFFFVFCREAHGEAAAHTGLAPAAPPKPWPTPAPIRPSPPSDSRRTNGQHDRHDGEQNEDGAHGGEGRGMRRHKKKRESDAVVEDAASSKTKRAS